MATKFLSFDGFAKKFGTLCGVICLALALVVTGCGGGKKNSGSTSGAVAPAEDFSYDLSNDGNGIKITGYSGNGGKVIIPAVIEDMPIVEIAEKAFLGGRRIGNTGDYYRELADQPSDLIKSLVVPASVVKIGADAFLSAAGLESVQILGELKEIPVRAFWGCDALATVNLPDSIEVIGPYAFANCSALTSLNLPESLNEFGTGAFRNCVELKNLTIPEGITAVKFRNMYGIEFTFDKCGKLPIKTRQTIQGWGYKGGF